MKKRRKAQSMIQNSFQKAKDVRLVSGRKRLSPDSGERE
jgi:hypothetical protein